MCDLTFINRASDGLILVEAWNQNKTIEKLDQIKEQSRRILDQIKTLGAGGHYEGGNCIYYFIVEHGICFMTVCPKNFAKNSAFAFLFEIKRCFLEELSREYGNSFTSYEAAINSVVKSYSYIRFDTVIHRKINDFQNEYNSPALMQLNKELEGVSSILNQNLNQLLDRGTKLEVMNKRAYDLISATKNMQKISKIMMLRATYQKHLPYILISLIIMIVIIWKWFF